jgi:hypothetical protein
MEVMNSILDRIIIRVGQILDEPDRREDEIIHGEREDTEAVGAVEVEEAFAEADEGEEAICAMEGGEEMPDSGVVGSDSDKI